MSADDRLHRLMAEARGLAESKPLVRAFMGGELDNLPYARPPPHALPATDLMLADAAPTCPDTAPLTSAIRAAAYDLHWAQSYTEDQVGADHLARYGWFNIVSPDGPFLHSEIRVSVGYWARGLHYPEHWHEPEEIYCVLAGGATFLSGDAAPREARAGDLIHHPPSLPHAMEMADSALLAIAFWRGANLLRPSQLEAGT